MTSLERKVRDAVPQAEAWTVNQVCTEMRRQGQRHDVPMLTAYLKQMVAKGLVSEPKAGLYQRVALRERVPATLHVMPRARPFDHDNAAPSAPAMETTMAAPTAAPPADPLAVIAALSARLRATATELATVAVQLDDMALDVAERLQRVSVDSQRLRQLSTLLAEIGIASATPASYQLPGEGR